MNFQLARHNMAEQQIKPWHVIDEKVLAVLSQIPREIFVPPAYLNLAYSDSEIPLAGGQCMLAPKVIGRALAALNLTGTEKVLEVGTGTGYITACLSKLANTVVSVEIQASLFQQAETILNQIHHRNIQLLQGDAVMGWEEHAPYDVIFITGAYPLGVPQKVCEQLHPEHGRLFAICGQAPIMRALLIERRHATQFNTTVLFETSAPTLINAPCPQPFQF